jgi:hypothetical protein
MQENQPKHRQLAKKRHKMERKKATRKENGSALLVCEGECTEPYYLRGLLQYMCISSASVEIIEGQTKSNAVSVVKRAQQRFDRSPRDRVFVLIDAEQQDLQQALEECEVPVQRGSKKKGLPEIRIEPIISAPCFEVWLLLHFHYCAQPFSCFEDVLPVLQASFPDYQKADPKIFLKVGGGEGLERALLHVSRLHLELGKTGSEYPDTGMDKLVEALRTLIPES